MQASAPEKTLPMGAAGWFEPGRRNVQLVYILYLVSLAINPTVLVGLVFAYISRGNAEDWIGTHYTYAIRTVWIGLLYAVICFLLAYVGFGSIAIGVLLVFVALIWFVIRCVKGLQTIARNRPIDNPQTWLV